MNSVVKSAVKSASFVFAALLVSCSAQPSHVGSGGTTEWPEFRDWPKGTEASRDVAVIVAIENYAFLPPVNGAVQTAIDWDNYFRQTRGMRDVFTLTDQNAPIEEVERFIDSALEKTAPDAKLWFVFVGHGAASIDGSDGLLIGMDAQQTIESIQKRSLSRNGLQKKLATGSQKNTVMIVDACFSGRSENGDALVRGAQPVIAIDSFQAANNFVLLTAAKADEIAGALPGKDRPAFSYLILGGLRGWADANKDGNVSVDEIERYSQAQLQFVPGRRQTPSANGDKSVLLAAGVQETEPDLKRLMSGQPIVVAEQKATDAPSEECGSNTDCGRGETCNEGLCGSRKSGNSAKENGFGSLTAARFGFADLDWSSTEKDVLATFGTPVQDDKVNARLRRISYTRKIFQDEVVVLFEFSSGALNRVMIVLIGDYQGSQKTQAYNDWNLLLEQRLGVGIKRSDGESEFGAVWELGDKTELYVGHMPDSLMIGMFNPKYLGISDSFAKPKKPGYFGGRVIDAKKDGKSFGAQLTTVNQPGPLAAIKIRVGDVIVAMDGTPIKSAAELQKRLQYYPHNALVSLKILRNVNGQWVDGGGTMRLNGNIEFPENP